MTAASIDVALGSDIAAVLTLVEGLLAELGDEGQEFARIDRDKLQADAGKHLGSGRFLALLAKDTSGAAIGVLTLSESLALYAGGEYGTIGELYVCPENRGRGVRRELVTEAVAIAREKGWFRLDVTGPAGEGGNPGDSAKRFYERMGFEFAGEKLSLLV